MVKKHLLLLLISAVLSACGSDPIRPSIPSAPTGVTATAGNGQVIVSWTAVTGATSYNIYYGTAAGVTTASTKITGATSPKTITGLTNNTTYYFVLTALNESGESTLSSEVPSSQPTTLTTPAGLSATPGDGQVTLTWTAVTGATSYNVYYGTAAGVTTASTKVASTASPCTITGLTNTTTYYFAVTATEFTVASSVGSETALSSKVSSTPQLPGGYAPATGAAINITNTYATLVGSFTNPASTTTESRFEWGTTTAYGTNTASLVYSDPGNIAPSIGITGLTAGTTYHYRFGIKTSDGSWWYGDDKTFTTTTLTAKSTIVSGLRYPGQFTVAATGVYWTEGIGSFNLYYNTVTGVTTAHNPVTNVTSGKIVSGLTNGLTYFFKAAAVDNGVAGTLSSEVSASLTAAVPGGGQLAAPTNVNVTASDASVTVSWTAVAGAASYNIYYDTVTPVSTLSLYNKIGAVSGGGVYILSPGAGGAPLANLTKYYFRVAAVSAGAVVGALSAEVGVTPHVAALATPYWLGITAGNTQVTLTWTAETGVVKSAPLAGGAATTLASGLSHPFGIAVNATNVFWAEQNSTSTGRGAVRTVLIGGTCVGAVGIAGTTCTTLNTTPLNNPQYIALDATNVYFTELGTFDTVSGMRLSDGTINKVPLAGGAVTQLATGLNGPQTIAVDATNIYWAENANAVAGAGFVKKALLANSSIAALVSQLSGSQNITLDSTDVYYWSAYGALSKVAIGGGNAVEVTSGMSGTQPLAIDTANVYWTENTNGGTVKKLNKSTRNVSIIVGLDCTWCTALGIAQDATYVYWMEGDTFDGTKWTGVGAIKKVAK